MLFVATAELFMKSLSTFNSESIQGLFKSTSAKQLYLFSGTSNRTKTPCLWLFYSILQTKHQGSNSNLNLKVTVFTN